jgi:hypothetical protein
VVQESSKMDGERIPKWQLMAHERCVAGMAYEMKVTVQGIDERKDVGFAKKLFGNLCAWLQAMREQTKELFEPMARIARMIEGHFDGILAHWIRELTIDLMERLNKMSSSVKRKASRYRTLEYMTTMLYFVVGRLSLPCC